MYKQKGGLKKKYPEKKGFKPVFDMINSPSANITLLTYKSLKGFMIRLDVSKEDSEYFTLSGSKFTKPVTSFILKFAVIAKENDTRLPIYKGIKKSSESKNSFFDEAKLQQDIWIKSILGGRPQICPSLANFSLFDNDNSILLLDFLKRKNVNVKAIDVFNYLLDCLKIVPKGQPKYGIGILVMPNIENSMQLGEFLNLPNPSNFNGKIVSDEDNLDAFSNIISQIIRLFLIGVIHFDLHSGNALIYLSPDQTIKTFIIDFGRVSNILNGIEDEYLTTDEKSELQKKIEENFDELVSISSSADDNTKYDFVTTILDEITALDKEKNQALFSFDDPDAYQMSWYEDVKNDPDMREIIIKAFDILKRDFTTEGTRLLPNTIKEYIRNGYLPNLDLGVDSFVNTFSALQSSSSSSASSSARSDDCDEESGMCTISGGKNRKTKRSKPKTRRNRNRKTRKQKK